jgi:F0F1-type ATP synthase gamma subunit
VRRLQQHDRALRAPQIRRLLAEGKTVKIFCVGRKGATSCARLRFADRRTMTDRRPPRLSFGDAQKIAARVMPRCTRRASSTSAR